MCQHTSGPWVGYENSEEGKHIISEAYPQDVIICEHVHTESDVALIAAAPAMYEALLQTCKVIEAIDDYQVFEDLQNVLIAINKTLAQAEGRG